MIDTEDEWTLGANALKDGEMERSQSGSDRSYSHRHRCWCGPWWHEGEDCGRPYRFNCGEHFEG